LWVGWERNKRVEGGGLIVRNRRKEGGGKAKRGEKVKDANERGAS